MNRYWIKRKNAYEKGYRKLGDRAISKTEKAIQEQYKRVFDELKLKLESQYTKLQLEATKGGNLISHLYEYNKYYEMMKQVQAELLKLGDSEAKILGTNLENMYKANAMFIGDTLGISTSFNAKKMEEVIAKTWVDGGVHWSTSIWRSQAQLTEAIREGLIDCVSTGKTTEEFAAMLMDRFGVSYKQAKRLARTELMHVQNQSAIDKYTEAGIKEYEILVGIDERTCEACVELEGKKFAIDEECPVPLHPNCRCTVIAVL